MRVFVDDSLSQLFDALIKQTSEVHRLQALADPAIHATAALADPAIHATTAGAELDTTPQRPPPQYDRPLILARASNRSPLYATPL